MKCPRCGEDFPEGTYHMVHCGRVYLDDRKAYSWNCCDKGSMKVRDLGDNFFKNVFPETKIRNSLIYE
ncbi:MAG: hypothetical protein ACTSUX_06850 [Promethearchaeota archaeon]